MMKRYEMFEHTADIGIRAFGKDMNELFANAAYGLFNQLADLSQVTCAHEENIWLEANNLEELLIDWLNELLYLFSVKKCIFRQFSLRLQDDKKLTAVVKGIKADSPVFHKYIKSEVKAATYHGLRIEHKGNLYVAEVIFDV